MGIFDFFKKTKLESETRIEQKSEPKGESTKDESKNEYLGDLTKTALIYNLLETPKDKRDDLWTREFLSNIPTASFRCGDPQVITGPDGFPYFQLFLPEPGVGFQCFVIENLITDFLLTTGFGIVINPTSNSADWVLSYGDILNFHLNKEFFSNDSLFSKATQDEVVNEKEEILVGQPSDTILPENIKKLLREYLKMNGISTPKIMLMMRKNNETITQDLAFNITPEKFENQNKYSEVMQTISWYLPRHYSFVGIDESSMDTGFMPL